MFINPIIFDNLTSSVIDDGESGFRLKDVCLLDIFLKEGVLLSMSAVGHIVDLLVVSFVVFLVIPS